MPISSRMKLRGLLGRRFLVFVVVVLIVSVVVVAIVGPGGVKEALYIGGEVRSVDGVLTGSVLQRAKNGDGSLEVAISGRVELFGREVKAGRVEAGGVLHENQWTTVDGAARFFYHGTVRVSPGWQHLVLRSSGSRGSRTGLPLDVGVGEVFIIAGQSNASGGSETLFAPQSALVRTADVDENGRIERWREGADPQQPNNGGSVWPIVGDRLVVRLGVPVGFVNVAVGGSSVEEWVPGKPYFKRLVATARALGPNGFRGVLWHQGETDAGHGMSTERYQAALESVISTFRHELGAEVPWMVAAGGFSEGTNPEATNRAQRALWAKGVALAGPDTDTLRTEFREPSNGVHLNEAGTRSAARLWEDAIIDGFFKGTAKAP